MAGTRADAGAGGRTGRRGRPRRVRQPSVETTSNTGDEGSATGRNPNNNEEVQIDYAIQASIVQVVAAAVNNLTPEGSAKSQERVEKSGEKSKKDYEREKDESSVVKSVKVDDMKRGRGGCNSKSFKGCDPLKLTGLEDAIATF